ncbi:hypothetical protein GGR58DRAFT_525808 [Xylaria digitata]|nr:hypothetical protein GGR58DRAFT_525808 [Xylaria digitata]
MKSARVFLLEGRLDWSLSPLYPRTLLGGLDSEVLIIPRLSRDTIAQAYSVDRGTRVWFGEGRERSRSPGSNTGKGKQPWVSSCYNCGEGGHIVRECPYEERPYAETQRICEALGARQPLPTDLTPLRMRNSGGDEIRLMRVTMLDIFGASAWRLDWNI